MSTYRGLWKIVNQRDEITDVQVEVSPGGISLPIDVNTYISRNCQPPVESLPTQDQYQKLN